MQLGEAQEALQRHAAEATKERQRALAVQADLDSAYFFFYIVRPVTKKEVATFAIYFSSSTLPLLKLLFPVRGL